MKQPNRIIQLNKEIRANAATIVIAAVLLYVVISVVSSLSKESVTIYQVSKGDYRKHTEIRLSLLLYHRWRKSKKELYCMYH